MSQPDRPPEDGARAATLERLAAAAAAYEAASEAQRRARDELAAAATAVHDAGVLWVEAAERIGWDKDRLRRFYTSASTTPTKVRGAREWSAPAYWEELEAELPGYSVSAAAEILDRAPVTIRLMVRDGELEGGVFMLRGTKQRRMRVLTDLSDPAQRPPRRRSPNGTRKTD